MHLPDRSSSRRGPSGPIGSFDHGPRAARVPCRRFCLGMPALRGISVARPRHDGRIASDCVVTCGGSNRATGTALRPNRRWGADNAHRRVSIRRMWSPRQEPSDGALDVDRRRTRSLSVSRSNLRKRALNLSGEWRQARRSPAPGRREPVPLAPPAAWVPVVTASSGPLGLLSQRTRWSNRSRVGSPCG